jgi:hypothetical protein
MTNEPYPGGPQGLLLSLCSLIAVILSAHSYNGLVLRFLPFAILEGWALKTPIFVSLLCVLVTLDPIFLFSFVLQRRDEPDFRWLFFTF